MSKGRFGKHGGQYIPETLMNEIHKLEETVNMPEDHLFCIMQKR